MRPCDAAPPNSSSPRHAAPTEAARAPPPHRLLELPGLDDGSDLENHTHDRRGQHHLLLLADERLEHLLLLHVVGVLA